MRVIASFTRFLACALLAVTPLRATLAGEAIPPAEIGGPSTSLKGLHLLYQYETGREYQLDFDADTVTFLAHKDPTAAPGTVFTPGTMHYRARKLRDDLYLVHWLNRSPEMGNIHVALIIDLKQKIVHVSALMPGGMEFFDIAHFEKESWNKGDQ
jgi:MoaF N-terminal domain